MKRCIKCEKYLEQTFFFKKKGNRDGLQSWCKNCDSNRRKIWRKEHPGHAALMSRLQRERNPEKMRRFVREYAKRHPDVFQRSAKRWASKNRHKVLAHKKLNYAVSTGKIKRMACERCNKKAHAHHDDYSRPLDVMWLCPTHHKERHKELIKLSENT